MVDVLGHIIFDGAPLIIPVMIGVSGFTIYCVSVSIDKLLNRIEIRHGRIEDERRKRNTAIQQEERKRKEQKAKKRKENK